MKYNEKYNRYVTKGGLVYRYDKKKDKLVLCYEYITDKGYIKVHTKVGSKLVHRLVYETFVGEIPQGYELDHINTIRDDNRLENLRCVTHKENSNNHLTRKHCSIAKKGTIRTEFGTKFKGYFGISNYEDPKLYHKELVWYLRHNKTCRWEMEV